MGKAKNKSCSRNDKKLFVHQLSMDISVSSSGLLESVVKNYKKIKEFSFLDFYTCLATFFISAMVFIVLKIKASFVEKQNHLMLNVHSLSLTRKRKIFMFSILVCLVVLKLSTLSYNCKLQFSLNRQSFVYFQHLELWAQSCLGRGQVLFCNKTCFYRTFLSGNLYWRS